MSTKNFLIRQFALKAKINADAAVKSVLTSAEKRGKWGDATTAIVAFQLSHQLISEGLELALKSLWLLRGHSPPTTHSLSYLLDGLKPREKNLVDDIVRCSIKESGTGALPYDLPNIAAVMLIEDIELGKGTSPGTFDAMSGYTKMDAASLFDAIDREWNSERTQYLGADLQFETRGTLRVNTRVLAGAVLVCDRLANEIILLGRRSRRW